MRHCHTVNECHSHSIQTIPGVSEGAFSAPDHEYPSYLELRLTVTDSAGLTDTAVRRLDPRTVDLTFRTEPPGLTLVAGQEALATPFTKTVIVGSRNSLSAPSPQSLNGSQQGFRSWSDGGTRTHDIVAPATATSYTATYEFETGLVLGYGFEETSGTIAADASPTRNNGTVNGATRSTTGRFGRALSFDGINDRVDVPDAASLDLSTAMTLEAWVRPRRYRLANRRAQGARHGHSSTRSTRSDGAGPSEIFDRRRARRPAPSALALNAWTHLASTYDGTTLRLFVNGTQVATARRRAMPNTADPLRIGGNAIWGEYFSGLIDEVRVYNRALSAAEIGTDMNTAVGSGAPRTRPRRAHPGT